MKEGKEQGMFFGYSVKDAAAELVAAGFSSETDFGPILRETCEDWMDVSRRLSEVVDQFGIVGLVNLMVREDPFLAEACEPRNDALLRLYAYKAAGYAITDRQALLFERDLRLPPSAKTEKPRGDLKCQIKALEKFQLKLQAAGGSYLAPPVAEPVEDPKRPFAEEGI